MAFYQPYLLSTILALLRWCDLIRVKCLEQLWDLQDEIKNPWKNTATTFLKFMKNSGVFTHVENLNELIIRQQWQHKLIIVCYEGINAFVTKLRPKDLTKAN